MPSGFQFSTPDGKDPWAGFGLGERMTGGFHFVDPRTGRSSFGPFGVQQGKSSFQFSSPSGADPFGFFGVQQGGPGSFLSFQTAGGGDPFSFSHPSLGQTSFGITTQAQPGQFSNDAVSGAKANYDRLKAQADANPGNYTLATAASNALSTYQNLARRNQATAGGAKLAGASVLPPGVSWDDVAGISIAGGTVAIAYKPGRSPQEKAKGATTTTAGQGGATTSTTTTAPTPPARPEFSSAGPSLFGILRGEGMPTAAAQAPRPAGVTTTQRASTGTGTRGFTPPVLATLGGVIVPEGARGSIGKTPGGEPFRRAALRTDAGWADGPIDKDGAARYGPLHFTEGEAQIIAHHQVEASSFGEYVALYLRKGEIWHDASLAGQLGDGTSYTGMRVPVVQVDTDLAPGPAGEQKKHYLAGGGITTQPPRKKEPKPPKIPRPPDDHQPPPEETDGDTHPDSTIYDWERQSDCAPTGGVLSVVPPGAFALAAAAPTQGAGRGSLLQSGGHSGVSGSNFPGPNVAMRDGYGWPVVGKDASTGRMTVIGADGVVDDLGPYKGGEYGGSGGTTLAAPVPLHGDPGAPILLSTSLSLTQQALGGVQQAVASMLGGGTVRPAVEGALQVTSTNRNGTVTGHNLSSYVSAGPGQQVVACTPPVTMHDVIGSMGGGAITAGGHGIVELIREHRGPGSILDDRAGLLIDNHRGTTASRVGPMIADVTSRFRVGAEAELRAAQVAAVRLPGETRIPFSVGMGLASGLRARDIQITAPYLDVSHEGVPRVYNPEDPAGFVGLDASGLTDEREYALPDASGTLALTSDIDSAVAAAGGTSPIYGMPQVAPTEVATDDTMYLAAAQPLFMWSGGIGVVDIAAVLNNLYSAGLYEDDGTGKITSYVELHATDDEPATSGAGVFTADAYVMLPFVPGSIAWASKVAALSGSEWDVITEIYDPADGTTLLATNERNVTTAETDYVATGIGPEALSELGLVAGDLLKIRLTADKTNGDEGGPWKFRLGALLIEPA